MSRVQFHAYRRRAWLLDDEGHTICEITPPNSTYSAVEIARKLCKAINAGLEQMEPA